MALKIEAQEQAALVEWLRLFCRFADPAPVIAAIPNGGSRNAIEGANLKKQGVLAGMPDLVMAWPGGRTVWVEMKSPKGRIEASQRNMHAQLAALGHTVIVARSAPEAIQALRDLALLK